MCGLLQKEGRLDNLILLKSCIAGQGSPHSTLIRQHPRCSQARTTGYAHQAWASQGAAGGDFDLVYAVNTLHIAHDLAFGLREARQTLAPGGWLVAGECMRPFPGQPLYVELVFQLLDGFTGVATDPDIRPNPGFLMARQWQRALGHAGFERVQVTPDQERIREIYPRFYVGAVCAAKR